MRDKSSKRPFLRRRFLSRGFSLVELMIALVISLLIIAVVGYIYVGNRNAFRTQTADSRLTDNARIAIEFLSRDLRLAGKFGCTRIDPEPDKVDLTVILTAKARLMGALDMSEIAVPTTQLGLPNGVQILEPGRMIRSYDDAVGFTGITLQPTSPRRPNTDVLEILKAGATGSHLVTAATSLKSDLLLKDVIPSAAPGTSELQTFVVADCNNAEILKGRVKNASNSAPGGAVKIDDPDWNKDGTSFAIAPYDTDTTVSRFEPVVYMVQNPSTAAAIQLPRLVRFGTRTTNDPTTTGTWVDPMNPEIIADGIEDFQIRFGVASAGGSNAPDRYMTATEIDGSGDPKMWRNVRSAEITLTVVSERSNVASTATKQVNSTVTDTRIRQQIVHVVSLRNLQQ